MYIYVCIISANVVTNIFSKLMAFYVGIMNYSMYVDMCEIVINFKGSEKGEVGEGGAGQIEVLKLYKKTLFYVKYS